LNRRRFLLGQGNVPQGAGLSSSASVEVATTLALLAHAGAQMEPKEIALLCHALRTSMSIHRAHHGPVLW